MIKNLQTLVLKNKLHIGIWALMLIYIYFAHDLHVKLFLDKGVGSPVQYEGETPRNTKQIRYGVGALSYIDEGHYALTGRALFDNATDSQEYDRYIVLTSTQDEYYYQIPKPLKRFKVYVSSEFINPGVYEISFLFRHKESGRAYYVKTKATITRTPNYLLINKP